jgi:malate synthase
MAGSIAEHDIEILGKMTPEFQNIFTSDAIEFVTQLHRKFNPQREDLLRTRIERQLRIDKGELPTFLSTTQEIKRSQWKVAPTPSDLEDRRVEITGPVERKMMINALNSGAKVFMADLEDSCSPTWENIIQGQINLKDAVRRTLSFTSPEGKRYELNSKTATLLLRPRGWHLLENNILVDGKPISASLLDFGLYFFHNAHELIKRGSGPYFYLPKMESHLEARLWNDVFNFTQNYMKVARGTIRATVLIETILAAFEMEEILYELREHMAGLNAGRWDYIFSAIKKFRRNKEIVFPDRSLITMTVPFMRSYTELLVKTCHKRGAHAIGGMAAFIPSRKDAHVNEVAISKVREDKQREATDGFDGTWVAHPDLVPVAQQVFDDVLKNKPNQKNRQRDEIYLKGPELIDFKIPNGHITEGGLRNNISVALQYVESWLRGVGAVGIFNLMEDAATAEISRSELWQWIKNEAKLNDGRVITPELYQRLRAEELDKLGGADQGRFRETIEILDGLVLNQSFAEFLTIPAYKYLN